MDLSGTVSVDAVRCVLESLKQHGVLEGTELEAVPLARGVRIATHGGLVDGQGPPSALARRLTELLKDSETAGVADLAPGGSYEVWTDRQGTLSLRTALHSPAEATHAARWLEGALAAEPSHELEGLHVATDGSTLSVRVPNPSAEQALLLRQNVLEAFRLPSASMLPTLLPGDHLFARKGPTAHAPARGDVVVFTSPREPAQDFVKRVIGVAGDHIELRGYALRINGRAVETKLENKDFVAPDFAAPASEPHRGELWSEAVGDHHYRVFHDASHPSADALDVTVEPDHVFVLGDNRDNSFDSRQFGAVPDGSVKGRAVMIWASFDEQAVRWERFGSEPE
jgi:signal peptidase I